jgi:tight adherence protein B
MPVFTAFLLFIAAAAAAFAVMQLAQELRLRKAVAPTPAKAAALANVIGTSRLLRDMRLSEHARIDGILSRIPFMRQFQVLLRQSGVVARVDQYLMVCLTLALVTVAAALMLGSAFFGALLLGALAGFVPVLGLHVKKLKRLKRIDQQLPDFLDTVARAMQAGNAFSGAMASVAKESPEPIGSEFRLVSEEINFGSSVREGLAALAERVASEDVRTFVVAVQVHHQTGGSLTTLLLKLATLIRDRQRLRKLGHVLSAEGRLSAWILTILPFATALIMYAINKDFIAILWSTPIGLFLIQGAAVLMVIGVVWMWRIIQFRI